MQKIKIHNKKLTKVAAFILEIILIANPLAVFAVGTVYDTDYNVRVSGNNISVYHYPFVNTDAPAPTAPPSSYANSFLYANYVDPTPGIPAVMGTDPDTGESYVITPAVPGIVATCQDSALDPNSVITSGTSPARGFCAGMLSCNNAVDLASIVDCSITNSCVAVNACAKAIADSYNTKIINALKKATDAKISSSDLDSTKANAAIESCGGDLACIDKVLTALQNDSSFASSNTSDPNAPLTVSSLSDLINSSNSSAADTGPINTAANDQGGLLGKTTGPKVDVTFNASSTGQVGSKMTANAVPSFFNNASDPKNLYFTWYLKRKGCDLKNSGVAVNDACNFDGDDKVTENDWKIAAAKIIVAGSFDKNEIKYNSANNSGFSNSEAGYEAIPAFSKKNSSGVNIGWRNGFLRDTADKLYENNDQDDAVANCYVQAPKSGRMYELRKVKTSYENACPNGSHRACVADQTAACNVFNVNPLYTENFAACAIASEDSDNEDVTCSFKDDAALKNFKATIACKDGKLPICVKDTYANLEFKDESQNVLGVIAATKPSDGSVVNNAKMCSAVAEPDPANPAFFLSNTEPIFTAIQEKCSTLQNGLIAGTKDEDGNTLITGNANLAPKCTFAKAENLCKHLFPVLPKEIKTADDKQAITGDGEFNLAEKEFWGADPTKASTTGNGKDEERAVGLGVDKFEWMFSTGDMVGVVVEGDATSPSEHANDASYQRMWAFSKGICTTLDEIEKSETAGITEKPEDANKNTRGFYIDGSKGILTAQVDLNDCLEENLLEPDAAGSAALKVQLVASPTNPTNDPSGKGDILNVTSSAANAQDSSGLLYKWSVQKSRDGSTSPIDTTSWIDITKPMENVGAFTAADVTGLGKKDLNINLNLQDPERIGSAMSLPYNGVFYLRVKLRITGSAADGSQDAEGITEPIRVKQQENQMLVYPAIAKDGGMLEIPTFNRSSQELCSDEQGKIACYVTKNQILGLE
ncbi:MAG: hypothetical protein HGA36_04850, partial [Candidatus Moranbacteria bacterium]|nr:hypothetical protein [Candidatus Moranbacteria bacterium]